MRIACIWLHRLLNQAQCAPPAESAERLRAERLERLAHACWRFTPKIALAPPDSFFLDVSGSLGLFGGESRLLGEILAEFERQGEPARVCLADTPGAAWAGTRAASEPVALLSPGSVLEPMNAWPVEALRLDPEDCGLLRELGLDTIGALGGIPPESLQARFGAGTALRLKQAAGQAPEPLDYLPPPRKFKARMDFESPVVLRQAIAAAVAELAVRLCDQLAAAGMGSRRFELRLHRSDGKCVTHGLRTARLIQPAPQLAELLDEKLQGSAPGSERGVGYDAVSLVARDTEDVTAEQADWLSGASTGNLKGDFARLVDRLCSRLGAESVRIPTPEASYLPERRWRFVPALDRRETENRFETPGKAMRAPLLLLERAELVEASAAAAGGPPAWIRWRRERLSLRRAQGPRRVLPEWWRSEERGGREYWLVEDEQGRSLYLYRKQPPGDESPRWYVQALAA
ncbi:MAG: DNA polymerase Y family protein [Gammaproteobacteria bacterium]|nr:DNA polymerase Y family protein [Gammaproteobacteria bacterium]